MSDRGSKSGPLDSKPTAIRTRGYQNEMFERSVQQNVIVAMDTGSGKTQIAVLRIMSELEMGDSSKLIWFLAPTVSLCTQQCEYIRSHIPAAKTKLLLGSDNVDCWSEQRIWDTVLAGVRIVVSTHAILADALTHGFVKISGLALLIFDEAHHCSQKHPANKIMHDFYHPGKKSHGSMSVPHILGLSASPVLRSNIRDLEIIESNLDAISITPRLHRQEMFKYVHRPAVRILKYREKNLQTGQALEALDVIYREYSSRADLDGKVNEQLHKFLTKAGHIQQELGAWASDYFIVESIALLRTHVDSGHDLLLGFRANVREALLQTLRHECFERPLEGLASDPDFQISPKLEQLISFLSQKDHNNTCGLIFIQQRVIVAVLCPLLSVHPQTKDRFRCATFVGLSNSAQRKYAMDDLLDLKAQKETLVEFRMRRRNLVLATDVLEEGMDISACNLVVCFDPPANLKSFIQRRGRARQERSEFALMFSDDEKSLKIAQWQRLEEELISTYQKETRQLQEIAKLEDAEDDMDDKLEVPETGAMLTPDSAISHLYHFCALLPRQAFVDLRPAFSFTDGPIRGMISATVTLPSCLSPSLRSAKSRCSWTSERLAMKDAAFQAYKALFDAGLLTKNLLPITQDWISSQRAQGLPAVVEICPQFDPWPPLAEAWLSPDLYRTRMSIRKQHGTKDDLSMILITAAPIPQIPHFCLYWDQDTTFDVNFSSAGKTNLYGSDNRLVLRQITHVLHRSTHSDQSVRNQMDYIVAFVPDVEEAKLSEWLKSHQGRCNALDNFPSKSTLEGFVRTPSRYGRPHIFRQWAIPSGDVNGDGVEIECIPLSRRRDFASPNSVPTDMISEEGNHGTKKLLRYLASECTTDLLPYSMARVGLFIPTILQRIEAVAVAEKLRTGLLSSVPYTSLQPILSSITAPSKQTFMNYQRYEFIGDAVLKYIISRQLFSEHPTWPEGFLSRRRDHFVSNVNLTRAALATGLEAYILTEPIRAREMSPVFISDTLSLPRDNRTVSQKLLADVVEALIGAAFVDAGIDAATRCIHVFLSNIHAAPCDIRPISQPCKEYGDVSSREDLLGHKFRNKALLIEALTHPSHDADRYSQSYQRLEFLGDAVLDMLVVSLLAEGRPELSEGQMSQIKAALVNVNLLGFLCLDFSISRKSCQFKKGPDGKLQEVETLENVPMWMIMRHSSRDIVCEQKAARNRYERLHERIKHCLSEGDAYPWKELAQLDPNKFFSDLVEAVLGAIFVDTNGDLGACGAFIEHIGLVAYARRAMSGCYDFVHPKHSLQRLLGSAKAQFSVSCEHDDDTETNLYTCKIRVEGADVAKSQACRTGEEALITAAIDAAEIVSVARSYRD